MKTLLSLFDYSGKWSKPFADKGWNVIQWDIKLSEFMDINLIENAEVALDLFDTVDGILAAPPCTDFSSSGAHTWKVKDEDGRTHASTEIAQQVLRLVDLYRPTDPEYDDTFFWAIENPVGRMGKLLDIGKPWYFDPCDFAGYLNPSANELKLLDDIRAKNGIGVTKAENDFVLRLNAYTKKTGLWGEFNIPVKNRIEPVKTAPTGSPMQRAGGKGCKTKEYRSNTPEGFAIAFCQANIDYKPNYQKSWREGMGNTANRATLQPTYASEHEQNLAIEQYVQQRMDNPVLPVSESDRNVLLRYTGRGQAFDKDVKISADAGLYEFYTPDYIRSRMWQLATHYGYDNGPVLEPSCATGHMFLDAPIAVEHKVGFEINPITAKIAQLCFPSAKIYNQPFETIFMDNARGRFNRRMPKGKVTWLPQYPFSLVIGNPPYGAFQGRYVSYFDKWMQVEHFFLYQSLLICKPGGLVVFLTASSWLRNGNSYQSYKEKVLEIGTLVDAYRCGEVFKHSGVPTDILIYRRK